MTENLHKQNQDGIIYFGSASHCLRTVYFLQIASKSINPVLTNATKQLYIVLPVSADKFVLDAVTKSFLNHYYVTAWNINSSAVTKTVPIVALCLILINVNINHTIVDVVCGFISG